MPVKVLLSHCVHQSKVDLFSVPPNVCQVVVENSRYITFWKRVGHVSNHHTGFSYTLISNYYACDAFLQCKTKFISSVNQILNRNN